MKSKRAAYSVARRAYSKKVNAIRYPLSANIFSLLLVIFMPCASVFVLNSYAQNLDNLKADFLQGDYKQAIQEGERLLASAAASSHSDELYYYLALSYLKDGNYLRASDIFEIILKEFKDSRFEEEAVLGLGDTYLLKGDLDKAQDYFESFIDKYRKSKLTAHAYSRLSQIGFRKGDKRRGEDYLLKLNRDFPLAAQAGADIELPVLKDSAQDVYYTVQVGSFAYSRNAENLSQILRKKGYDAYVEESGLSGKKAHKVRVGRFSNRGGAVETEKRLSQEGFSTRILP